AGCQGNARKLAPSPPPGAAPRAPSALEYPSPGAGCRTSPPFSVVVRRRPPVLPRLASMLRAQTALPIRTGTASSAALRAPPAALLTAAHSVTPLAPAPSGAGLVFQASQPRARPQASHLSPRRL